MEDLFDYLGVHEEIKKCQPRQSFSSLFSRMRPRVLRANYQPIEELDIEIFPFVPLLEILKREAVIEDQEAIFASSMTIGTSSAAQLAEALRDKSLPVFLALDAGVVFSTGQGAVLASNFGEHANISVIPMTSGNEFKTIHHWKIVVGSKGNRSTLSSMNLSTPLKTAFSDLAYSFNDPEVAAELRGLIMKALIDQCSHQEQYHCLVDFLHTNEAIRDKLYKLNSDSCTRLSRFKMTDKSEGRHFMQPQNTDLEHLVHELINKSSSEVIILSHKFSLKGVFDDLINASQRGVSIRVFTTKRPQISHKRIPGFFKWSSRLKKGRHVPDPHMKLMIVDRKLMFLELAILPVMDLTMLVNCLR